MSRLTQKYRETRSKDFEEARTPFAFKTGIDVLDYKNGRYVSVKGGKDYLSVGIDEGSYVMVIGPSASGKSAFVMQVAGNIVRDYEDGAIYHDDVEAASDRARIKALTKFSDDEMDTKYVHRNIGVTAESFYKNIRAVYDLKMEMKDELMIKTDKVDAHNKPIHILPPTVYILDSLAVLIPESQADADEISGGMGATAIAKVNSQIFQRIVPLLKKANIILFVVNHINQQISINPMQPVKAQLKHMKQDESIPGGKKPIYLANNIFKIEAGSVLTDDKEYGINGFKNTITIIKSRSNRAGQKMDVIYDQDRGYDNIYTNYELLKGSKLVGGAGRGFYLGDLKDVKFSQKDFRKKLAASKPLKKEFITLTKGVLKQFIYNPKTETGGDGVEVEE